MNQVKRPQGRGIWGDDRLPGHLSSCIFTVIQDESSAAVEHTAEDILTSPTGALTSRSRKNFINILYNLSFYKIL
jgi:hypothetical protein